MSLSKSFLILPVLLACLAVHPARSQNRTVETGEALFARDCASCHNFIQRGIGPDLSGVTAEVNPEWLKSFIRDSQKLVKSGDTKALALFKEYKTPMPAQPQLSDADLNAILAFLAVHKKKVQPENTSAFGPALDDPIPAKIEKAGITLHLKQVNIAPATSSRPALARINQMTVLKGSKGIKDRVFLHDMRGPLYEMKGDSLHMVMDMSKERPPLPNPGLATGFGSYAFHPAFYSNGLLYTTHTEKAGTAKADYGYADSIPVAIQWVLTEWKIDDPLGSHFTGKSRELMRINMPTAMHGVQQIVFNPLSRPGDKDYGLLYIGVGDGGSAEYHYSHLCNSNTQIRGAVLRIDPLGRNSANGQFGIPKINPFASDADPATLGELFTRGFRNPNRISWSPAGMMLISDIGLNNVEELNIGLPGRDYGWPAREGTFLLNYKGKMNKVYALPAAKDQYTYPVAQYDHDEGNACSAGFVYTGPVESLKGKYIFGDIVKGRVFYVESSALRLGSQTPVREFDLDFDGVPATFLDIVKESKADLRFGVGLNGEFYLYTKTDGKIWKIVKSNNGR